MGVGPTTSRIRSMSLGPHTAGAMTGASNTGYRFGQMGSVASLVAGFNTGNPLPAIPNLSALDSTSRRHDGDDDDDE